MFTASAAVAGIKLATILNLLLLHPYFGRHPSSLRPQETASAIFPFEL